MSLTRRYPSQFLKARSWSKITHYCSTHRTENFEQLDLFVQNVLCCVFESNTVSKKLLRASPVLNARDSWELKGFSALMSLPGLKKQFNSAWDLFMHVKSPTAFEEQPLAPESLNNHQRRQHTRGVGAVHSNCHNCPQSKTNGSFSSPLIPRD